MKKLFLGLIAIFAFMAFSTTAMATVNSDSSYVQTMSEDEKCGAGKCADDSKCGAGKCGRK